MAEGVAVAGVTLAEQMAARRNAVDAETAERLRRAERTIVMDALNDAGVEGVRRAAEVLGLDVAQLRDLIVRHRLRPVWLSDWKAEGVADETG